VCRLRQEGSSEAPPRADGAGPIDPCISTRSTSRTTSPPPRT
jgi:hypothetical protein